VPARSGLIAVNRGKQRKRGGKTPVFVLFCPPADGAAVVIVSQARRYSPPMTQCR
jgi:hypothetical protein